jgi:hypothetical protein
MHDHRRYVDVSELSRELVRDFLLIDRYELPLPKRIILYGSPTELMLYIANAMGAEFAGRIDVTITVLSRVANPYADGDAYCIDVGYFLAPDLSIPAAAIGEASFALLSTSEASADRASRGSEIVRSVA